MPNDFFVLNRKSSAVEAMKKLGSARIPKGCPNNS